MLRNDRMNRLTDQIKVDRSVLTYANLTDPPDDLDYWRDKTFAERMTAIELLRQLNYGYDPNTARLQRVLEYAQLERR